MAKELKGVAAAKKELREIAKLYPAAAAAALYQEAITVIARALPRTPVQFGVLRSSAYASPPTDEEEPRARAGFGTAYAAYQHERKNLRHPRGGEAFYLRTAFDETQRGFDERMAERIKKNAAAGVGIKGVPAAVPTSPSATAMNRAHRKGLRAKLKEQKKSQRVKAKARKAAQRAKAKAKKQEQRARKKARKQARLAQKRARRAQRRK